MSNSKQPSPAPGQPIPIPEDFPVAWTDPSDARLSWGLDNHVTEPMAPLACSTGAAILRGFNPAFRQLGMPIQFRIAHFNGYPYAAVVPTAAPPEAVMKTIGTVNRFAPGLVKLMMGRMATRMSKQQLQILDPILERLEPYWQDDILPEIRQHLAYFESCNLRGLSLEQLRAYFSEGLQRAERLGELHLLATLPAMTAMSLFEELYCELFEEAAPLDAMRLLQGFDNESIKGDLVLWQLSRSVLETPIVSQVLAECAAAEVIPALERSGEGQDFLGKLHAYLDQYGKRFKSFAAITEPSWIEDPTPVIEILKAYITRADARPEAEQTWLADRREQAVSEARARLKGYPQQVVTRFETLLKAAQAGTSIKEDSHWAALPVFYYIRRLALELGRRLAQDGVLETADDVFYLTGEELLNNASNGPTGPSSFLSFVRERKARLEKFRHITPPARLGTMPPFEAPDGGPLFKAATRGEMNAARNNGDSEQLRGEAGSSGLVRGTAKVVRSLSDAGKLQPGDVLVTERTTPPWTPLFAIASAVVTDIGGVLSHCAIVAREYHIPAVVGTGRATKTFHDGQVLEVDGDAGLVRAVASE